MAVSRQHVECPAVEPEPGQFKLWGGFGGVNCGSVSVEPYTLNPQLDTSNPQNSKADPGNSQPLKLFEFHVAIRHFEPCSIIIASSCGFSLKQGNVRMNPKELSFFPVQ